MTDDFSDTGIPSWEGELRVAPDRYPVPALDLPPLEPGTLVTFGEPGGWWAIDQGYAATAPVGHGDSQTYGVVLLAEEAGASLRHDEVGPSFARTVQIPARDLWVYRDSDQSRDIGEVGSEPPLAWLDRVLSDDLTPPPLRRPRPARELPSLSGQRVRVFGDGQWQWLVAVSEPLTVQDSIMVKVIDLHQLGPMLAGRTLPAREPGLVSLHRLWIY